MVLDTSARAYDCALHSGELGEYAGRYVAFVDGEMVDHGEHERTLRDWVSKVYKRDIHIGFVPGSTGEEPGGWCVPSGQEGLPWGFP